MKACLFTLLILISSLDHGIAQQTIHGRSNSLSIELGKNGLIYNIIYDHRFKNKNLGVRVGAGSNFSKYLSAFVVGGGGYYLVGKSTRFLELGADIQYLSVDEVSDDQKGLALVYPDYSTKTYYASFNLGYRRNGKSNLFRIGISPGFTKDDFIPGAYISYGMSF